MADFNTKFEQKIRELQNLLEEEKIHLDKQKQLLEKEKQLLEKEKEALTLEKPVIETSNQLTQDIIHLNVGGTLYSTSRTTLCRIKNTMIEAMFSGRHNVAKDAKGRYFIDRSGVLFEHVLKYLRDDKITFPKNRKADLMDEFDYYGIPIPEEVNYSEQIINCPNLVVDKKSEDAIIVRNEDGSYIISSSSRHTCLASQSFASGSHYWEVQLVISGSASHAIAGIATADTVLTSDLGFHMNANKKNVGWWMAGTTIYGAVSGETTQPCCPGDFAGFMLDLDNNTLTLFVNKKKVGMVAIPKNVYFPAFDTIAGAKLLLLRNAKLPSTYLA